MNTDEYKERPYEYTDLGEVAVIGETMWGWWKHRFLINHNTKRAYEFMDKDQRLVTVTEDDIDWESLKGLPEDAISTARSLSFHFPSSGSTPSMIIISIQATNISCVRFILGWFL